MAVSKNLTAEILQFPGYSGKWWFEEVPYLLPFVRERIAVPETRLTHLLMNNPHEAKGAKENDLPILTTLSQESETVQRLIEFLVKAGQTMEQKDSNRRNLTDLEPLVDQYLSEIPEHSPSASVLHTQAVLLHYLSVFLQKTNREQQARELYARAIQLYETETNESSLFLCKLCRFDAARLEYWINGNADEFQRQANAIEVGDADDLAFRLNLMIVPAVEQMKAGRNQDAVFTGAFQLLEQLERLEPLEQKESPHPMRTALHFLYADVLSRQWRLEPAEIHWRTLEKLATQKALQDKTNEREARFCCGAGCAKLALAAISRYFGDLNKARYRYRELIGNIQDTLSMTSGAQKESVHLTRQLAESWEGLADCTLFVPTHFDKTSVSVVNAPFFIGEAETGYRQAYDLAADPAIKFVLQCKLALLRFNAENLNETNQQHSLNELRTRFQELSSMDVDYERAKEYHDLTEAVLGISNENIQAYLDQNRLNPNLCDRYAGERLDLQLFAIRSLLLSERTTNCFAAQQDIKRYLDPILLQHLVLENKMRPFLLPFYDLAICSPEDNDFVQITARIRAARCQHSLNRLSKKQLVFYFPLDNSNGFTFFLSPDEHENQRFNLGVNRRQVIEAADNGQTLPLPADLVQRVNVTWEQSERLGVSWDDSVCWTDSQAKKRLTLLQWIFNSNIDRDRLLGTIR
jgi:hypothetical protein